MPKNCAYYILYIQQYHLMAGWLAAAAAALKAQISSNLAEQLKIPNPYELK